MRNKKIVAMVAGLAALTVAGGSFAAFAAESKPKTDYSYVAGQENGSQYADADGADENADKTNFSYVTGQENGTKYADSDEQTDKTDYSYVTGQENGSQYADAEGADENADKTNFSFNTGKENGTQYAPENLDDVEIVTSTDSSETSDETTETEVQADYSYNAGQQNAQSRNSIYENLPEGGTKEDAEAFYEQNDVGGGAWVDGAYDESEKADYGYVQGQQRGSSYAQDTDGEVTPDKSGYSYSTGRQSYEQNHATWTWGE